MLIETQIVSISVLLIISVILSSTTNYTNVEIGTITIESLQQAISVIIHSGLFSEKIPINFKSGVPSTSDFTIGHSFFFIIIFERSSTI